MHQVADTVSDLAVAIAAGSARAIARGISLVEDESEAGPVLIGHLFARAGGALIVGVTGAPGAGKSTLVDRLVGCWRSRNQTVGVLAVDPTSPYSGGAMLGDRVRMQAHAQDAGVFIRSMATRGHLGGLARATADAATLLDASGKDIVAIETVGVGQDEVDVVRTADVCVVVLMPGMGDGVQALKAGIMEIADIFVVNKSDREGAERTVADIESVMALHEYADDEWRPPIVRTQATSGAGIEALDRAVTAFRTHAPDRLAARRHDRAEGQLRAVLAHQMMRVVESKVDALQLAGIVDRIASRQIDPYSAAAEILEWTSR
jgi:LAO/AO transport system kinase